MKKTHIRDENFKRTAICGMTINIGDRTKSLEFYGDERFINLNDKRMCKRCKKKYIQIKSNERR